MTALAGIHHDFAARVHAAQCSKEGAIGEEGCTGCAMNIKRVWNVESKFMQMAGKPLQGKTVLITGAAKRLGRASALALAQAGADVAITFNTSAREAQHTVI